LLHRQGLAAALTCPGAGAAPAPAPKPFSEFDKRRKRAHVRVVGSFAALCRHPRFPPAQSPPGRLPIPDTPALRAGFRSANRVPRQRQTTREGGTQSHGSSPRIARLPKGSFHSKAVSVEVPRG